MSMPGVSMPNTPNGVSHGFTQKTVRVQTTDPVTRIAICIDNLGKTMQIRYDIMRSKGNMPEPGETWIVDRTLFNLWTFAAIITGNTDGVAVATVNGLPAAITTINSSIDHTNSNVAANFLIRPTGSIEMTILRTPPAGAIFLQGQLLNRADFPNLWSWIVNNGMLDVGLFGPGDGSTNFGCPDWRDLLARGASTSDKTGELVGQDSQVLDVSQMPSHTHSVVHSQMHTHDFTTALAGGHAGHFQTAIVDVAAGTGIVYGLAAWNSTGTPVADHQHSGTTGTDGVYYHIVGNSGGSTAVDMRQASVGVNWMIWT